MKLVKIYSNDKRFKPIFFNEGFNIIYGNVEQKINDKTGKVSEHNLGKTAFIYLIDFLLLKKQTKKTFFGKGSKLYNFLESIFFLELKLNNGKYLTIRRAVNQNTKISFKKHFSKNQDFINESNWDYENLSLFSKDDDKNPKYILENKYLKFDVNSQFGYRNFLSYLLRTQNDYQDVFELNKLKRSDHKDWKPALFQLLGFDANLLKDKYGLDEDIKEEKKDIKKLQNNNKSDNEIYKIKAAIEAKEIEKKDIQLKIDNFDFYKKEQNISLNLVRNIENKVSSLNKENYIINYDIEQIQKSLDLKKQASVNINDIQQLFKEVQVFFPDNLVKDYNDVVDFSSQITKEREKYLKNELEELTQKQKNINENLKELNSERTEMLSNLKEKDTFVKYKKYQDDLIKIESEIFSYKKQLEDAKQIEYYENSIANIKIKIEDISEIIKKTIDQGNNDFQEIKKIFQEIYKKTFEYTALLVLKPNKNGNVDFEATVLDNVQKFTGKGDGYTSIKVLCSSFVLAILSYYSNNSFFRFAYHDGILESWGDNHKIHFIELVREYCEKYGIQYIISLIKTDVPQQFTIFDNEIIRTLSKNDKLFGFDF